MGSFGTVANEAMAEGVGFEPTREREPPGGFQDRCLKPLGHPSRARVVSNGASRCSRQRGSGRARSRDQTPSPSSRLVAFDQRYGSVWISSGGEHMKRRESMSLLAGAAAWVIVARALSLLRHHEVDIDLTEPCS